MTYFLPPALEHIKNTYCMGKRPFLYLYAVVNLKPQQLIIKDSARDIVLLKQTIEEHEASCSLSATAELLVTNTPKQHIFNFLSEVERTLSLTNFYFSHGVI